MSSDFKDPVQEARRINPETARCWIGFWGEDFDFGDFVQRVLTRTPLWVSPEGDHIAPDYAMRAAWPALAPYWTTLQRAAIERAGASESLSWEEPEAASKGTGSDCRDDRVEETGDFGTSEQIALEQGMRKAPPSLTPGPRFAATDHTNRGRRTDGL